MNFDEIIDRRGTHSAKWDAMESIYGLSPEEGLPMWVADMDFRPPACVQDALQEMLNHGIYGYFGDDRAYKDAICWWMKTRNNWEIQPEWIFSTHGLVNGTALCLQTYTQPGDGVVLFTPVYHAFGRVIRGMDRDVVECPLVQRDGRYEMDFAAYDAQMTGKETLLILCSPHNPGGRVWTVEELKELGAFAKRHDLIIVSDEIHSDLLLNGAQHTPMAVADESILDRLVMMTATTKTFNIAGGHTGNVIIPDEALRKQFAKTIMGFGISPNSFAVNMATAAYSPEGALWVDELQTYLSGNAALFDEGMSAIPGVKSMKLEGTYLAWVDFKDTGLDAEEVKRRILEDAKIAVNYGEVFGKGGETFQRFNLAMPRAQIAEAVERMQKAFADLQ